MMRMSLRAWLIAVVIVLSPTFALAQRSEPGAVAIGTDFGLTLGGGRDEFQVGAGPSVEAFTSGTGRLVRAFD